MDEKKYNNAVGFIGGGKMSSAIFQGILKSGVVSASQVWVSGPRLHNLKEWKKLGANVTTKNGDVLVKCKTVFLGVKPSFLRCAVDDCLMTLGTNEKLESILFISMLAGITISQLHKELAPLKCKARVIRIMPNTPMTVGEGACLYTPCPNVSETDCSELENFLNGSCVYSKVAESQMDTLGALVGCGPAYMFVVIDALADGAVKQGAPRDLAIKFAAQVMLGSGKMVLESAKHPSLLKDEVCSPGGSTICGVAALENGKVRGSFINAIEASALKNRQLGVMSTECRKQ